MKYNLFFILFFISSNTFAQVKSEWEHFEIVHPEHWKKEDCIFPIFKLVTYIKNGEKEDWLLMNIKEVNTKYMKNPTIDSVSKIILNRLENNTHYEILENQKTTPSIYFFETFDKSQNLTEMTKIFQVGGKFYQALFYFESKAPMQYISEGRAIFNSIVIK